MEQRELLGLLIDARTMLKTGRIDDGLDIIRSIIRKLDPDRIMEKTMRGGTMTEEDRVIDLWVGLMGASTGGTHRQ